MTNKEREPIAIGLFDIAVQLEATASQMIRLGGLCGQKVPDMFVFADTLRRWSVEIECGEK